VKIAGLSVRCKTFSHCIAGLSTSSKSRAVSDEPHLHHLHSRHKPANMGLLDDAASTISGRSSHTKHSKHNSKHRKHRSHSKSDSDHKRRSRSRSRTRSHYSASHVGLPSVAASFFGGDERDRHDKHKHRDSTRSFFGSDDKHESRRHKEPSSNSRGLFGLTGGNASTRSFFGFGMSLSPPSAPCSRRIVGLLG
jgi:hypothetical protein